MAYSEKDWEVVRAYYQQGLSLAEIIETPEVKKIGITDRSGISKKAKKEGWLKGKNSTLVEKVIQSKQLDKEIEKEKSTFNSTELDIFNSIVDKKLRDLELCDKAQRLVIDMTIKKLKQIGIDNVSFQDINAAGSAIQKSRDGLVGKELTTVINNSNTAIAQSHSVSLVNIPAHELKLAYYGELDDEY